MKRLVTCMILLLFLSGCSFPTQLFFDPPPVGQPGDVLVITPDPTATPEPTDPPVTPTAKPCAYAWANKELPDETAVFQEALKKAGLGLVEVTLSAYGENCLDTQTDQVVSFGIMQTDFYFNIPVSNLNDKTEKGNWAAKVLAVVKDFPPGKVPGPNRGVCGMTFQTLADSTMLRFQVATGLRALEAGLSGEELFSLLSRP